MQKFLIEHVLGGRWLTQHNFSTVQAQGIRFDTKEGATEYLRTAGLGRDHNIVPAPIEDEGLINTPGQAVIDYDPHSFMPVQPPARTNGRE